MKLIMPNCIGNLAMRKIIAAVLTCCVSVSVAMADEITLNDGVPDVYIVEKGDTLWDISDMFLQDPWKWQELWYNNPQIDNPHLIFPGDVIAIVMVDGQQRITVVNRGGNANTLVVKPDQAENGVVKLRPTARITPVVGAIPAIPREYVEGFLSGNRILNTEELISAPYVLGGVEGRLLMGPGDAIYARGEFNSELPVYQIYRVGKAYEDPVSEEHLGFEAIELGTARIEDLQGEVGTFELERTRQQISIKDRILPSDESLLESVFYPSEPPEDLNGKIVDVTEGGVEFIGQFDVVLLDVGERDGVASGNVFRVMKSGDLIKDPVTNERLKLPDEEGGLVMVFRVFDKMSYGLVLNALLPMRIGDAIVNPGF